MCHVGAHARGWASSPRGEPSQVLQGSFRHAQAQNRTSMGLFFRGLSMFQTSVYMTSNPVNNRGAANKRQPGAFSVGCRCLHLGLPSALLCPALLRGSPAVF